VKQAAYDVVAPLSRLAVFHTAKRRERKLLLDFFDQLARSPGTTSEWTLIDQAGRTNYQTAVDGFSSPIGPITPRAKCGSSGSTGWISLIGGDDG